jgi:DNA replication protein DnaC
MRERVPIRDLPSREAVFELKTKQERAADYAREHALKLSQLDGLIAEVGATLTDISPELEREERAARARAEAEKMVLWRAATKEATRNHAHWVNAFSPKETEARTEVKKWLEADTSDNLVLRGGIGSCKTSAACYAVRMWVEPKIVRTTCNALEVRVQEPCVTWMRPDALVTAMRKAWSPDALPLHRYIVIDDLGTESDGRFEDCLEELLEKAEHKIIMTTNVLKPEWQARYPSARLISRFRGHCVARDITTPDQRRGSDDF